MKNKIIFILIISLLALSSCSTAATPTATQAPTNTPASTAETPNPTDTPQPTFTPKPQVKPITYADMAHFRFDATHDDFQPITQEQLLELQTKITTDSQTWQLKLDDSVKPMQIFGYSNTTDGKVVQIAIIFGESGALRYAVKVQGPHGIMHLILWEVIVKEIDGRNKRMMLTTSWDPIYRFANVYKYNQDYLQAISREVWIQMNVLIALPSDPNLSPVMQDVMGEPARKGLETLTFTDEINLVPLLVGHLA